MADDIIVVVEPPLSEIVVFVESPLPEVVVTLSEVGLVGPTGPQGPEASDPPIDLTLLFENALV